MLNFHFLNVQNGDSIVIEYEHKGHRTFAVIDSNVTGAGAPAALTKLQELGAEHLSFVCITHPHADHYRGLFQILEHYQGRIDQLYTFPAGDLISNKDRLKKLAQEHRKLLEKQDDPELTNRSLEWIRILKHASEHFFAKGLWQEPAGPQNTIFPTGFDEIEFSVIMPPPKARGSSYIQKIINEDLYDPEGLEANELSIALMVTYAGKRVMLGGDAWYENWMYSKKTYKQQKVAGHVVKLPHHGSKRDCNEDTLPLWFLEGQEKIGIISAKGNKHPDGEVLDWLLKNEVRPYCTNLSKKWTRGNTVDFINVGGLEGNLQRVVKQHAVGRTHRVQACQGNICVQISASGVIQVITELENVCGCRMQQVDQLLAQAGA